jgi:hypothetical protein
MVNGGDTTMESDLVLMLLLASVALTVKVEVAAALGVPVMTPVLGLRLSPVGNVPLETDQVTGAVPPVEVKVVE